MAIQKPQQQEGVETMRLKDLFALYLSKWQWFALSLAICLSLAMFYLLRQHPVYTRTASILVKEDNKQSFSTKINSFTDMGFFDYNSNVYNELASIQSPAVILETVKRLHLDMNYTLDGVFHDKVVYGRNLPVQASIIGIGDNDFARFRLDLDEKGQATLFDFYYNGEELGGDKVTCQVGDTVTTQLGRIAIKPTPYYKKGESFSIKVYRNTLMGAVAVYTSRLGAELHDENTTIISLFFRDYSIQRAEEFLNTLISVYNENWVKDKNQIAVSTSEFINERLGVIERELGNVDSDISSYKSEHLIPDVKAASNMYMEQANQANAQILDLNNQLYMARYIRNFVSGEGGKNQLLPANSGISSPIIERQIAEYNTKLLERNSLVANSSVSNPLVTDMDNQLVSMRRAIISSIDNQINSLNTQIGAHRSNEQASTARIASNPTQAKYLLSVERQQKVKESLYLFLLQKREENELSQAFTAYNTRIITPPIGSFAPTSPNKRNILLVGLLAGLLIPAAVLLLLENMNTKVRGRKDLEKLTIPFVGEIPQYLKGGKKQKTSLKKQLALIQKGKQPESGDDFRVVVKAKSRNMINEAFRVVRTNIEFMLGQEEKSHVIMVSSVNAGSGKTFTTINLASSFAIKGKKVVVVDLDMRKASLSKYVQSPKQGISNYLSGQVDNWRTTIVMSEDIPGVDVIPVGTIPPNPTELLFNPKLQHLLNTLHSEYDYIFLDCPPVEIVADTSIISKWADLNIFIIRANLMERDMLPVVEGYYKDKKFSNMAILLNGTTSAYSRYGYSRYGYHYGYGYGYGYGGYTKEDKDK